MYWPSLISFATTCHGPIDFAAIAVAPHPAPRSNILRASFPASCILCPKIRSLSSRMNLVSACPPGQYMDQNASWNMFLVKESSPALPSPLSVKGSRYKGQLSVSRNNLSSGVMWSWVISVLSRIVLTTFCRFSVNLLSDVLLVFRRTRFQVSFVPRENSLAMKRFFKHATYLAIIADENKS